MTGANWKGLTLVEVVIVLTIIVIFAAIALPRFSGLYEKAREATDEATAAAISKAVIAHIASDKLSSVPDYNSLPSNLVDHAFKFRSLKYGGPNRNLPPVLSGTVGVVIVSGNGNQAYPK